MKYFGILISFFFLKAFGQCGALHQGVYTVFESLTYNTNLKQSIPSASFQEEYNAEIYSYPSIKLGYSITAWGNLGLMSDWTVWGVDFGAGLSYSKSVMNALDENQYFSDQLYFDPAIQNGQVFFNNYQPGNQCEINDYGINLHVDAGTIAYIGAELDAGPSRLVFTDNRISEQRVSSVGWFANTRIQAGMGIPLSLRCDADFKLNMKLYAVVMGWSSRTYKMDWIAPDKKLKNFSVLKTDGAPLGIGFSLTFLFRT